MHRNPYAALFRAPGTAGFFVAGLIARFPLAMMTLGIVIMANHTYGGYKIPGLIASVCMLANALISPQLSRLADRNGQARVALPAVLLASTAFCLLIATYRLAWPPWMWFVCAAGMGMMPNFGAFSRARWSYLYSGTSLLRTAFALESLCEEMVWMSGPIIVVWCSTHLTPDAGVVAAALLFVSGALIFCAQKRTQPRPTGPTIRNKTQPAIFNRAVFLPCMTLLAAGGFFGVLEVASTAFAKEMGVPEKTFYPLTAYAIGSFITGSIYGVVRWKWSLRRQLLLVSVVFVLTTLPFCFIDSMGNLTLVCFIAGATCSPSIIIVLGLVESLVDKAQLTESMTWVLVSMPIGMASGFALTGDVVDALGAAQAFYGTVLCACISLVVVVLAQPWLVPKTDAPHAVRSAEPASTPDTTTQTTS